MTAPAPGQAAEKRWQATFSGGIREGRRTWPAP